MVLELCVCEGTHTFWVCIKSPLSDTDPGPEEPGPFLDSKIRIMTEKQIQIGVEEVRTG